MSPPAVHTQTHTYTNKHCQSLPLCQLCLWPTQVLEQVSPNPSEVKCDIALQNPTRNRSEEFVPGNYTLIKVSTFLSLFSVHAAV